MLHSDYSCQPTPAKYLQNMATVKLYLDKRAARPGEPAPLKISLCFHGKTALHSTGVKIMPEQWDADKERIVKHPQKQYLNSLLNMATTKWEQALWELAENGMGRCAKNATELKKLVLQRLNSNVAGCKNGEVRFLVHFLKFADSRRTAGNREAYHRTIVRMRAFDDEIEMRSFEDIDKRWLEAFERFMSKTAKSANARAFHLRNIRAVFNDAIDEELTTAYPFRKFKIRREATPKRALTVEQLRELASFPCEAYQKAYRDMFMLMFMLIGINGADLFAALPDSVVDGRLEYVRAKTHKFYSIKIEPEAAELLKRYKGTGHLVWVSDVYANHRDYLHRLGVALKQIGPTERHGRGGKKTRQPLFPRISQYWCRHSWATIAASLDIPKETIAAALGHGGNSVTDIYIDFDRKKVDEANRRVIDWVLYGKR